MKATIEGISTTMRFQRHEYGPKDNGLKLSVIEKESELTGGTEGTAVVRYTAFTLGDGSRRFSDVLSVTRRTRSLTSSRWNHRGAANAPRR